MKASILALLVGQGLALPLVVFLGVGAAVFVVASRLARHADAIADATGLGRLLVGTILLSAATSLPELVTDVSAAALGALDIGIGDLLGSTLANMLILASLDLVYARRRILQSVAIDHALVGTLAILMTGLVTLSIAVGGFGRLGPVGVDALLVFGLYLFGMRVVFQATRVATASAATTTPEEAAAPAEARRARLRRGVLGMLLSASGLLLTAPLLVIAAEAIALEAGVSQGFVGTTLVGFTTSFPEIAASVAAVRMGALDLAVGNLFGSNAFNLCIVLAMDLAAPGAPVLSRVSGSHVVAGIAAMLAIGLGMLAILARSRQQPGLVRFESLMIVAVYALVVGLLSRG